MKILVLAAGRSRRTKPIEDKNFLKFAGKTLIEHQLDTLKRVGLTDVTIVGGAHNMKRLREIAALYSADVVEQKNLDEGMAGAVLAAEEAIGSEPVIIFSSNDVLAQSAFEKMQKAMDGKGDAFMLAYKVKEYFPGGYMELDGNRITGLIEKPEPGTEPSDLVNIVVHGFKKPQRLFDALKEVSSERDDRYEVALDQLMKEFHFEAVPYDSFWQPIKFPWHVLDLMAFSLKMAGSRIHPTAEVSPSAVIRGDVVLEEGVKVFDNAVIQGPAYIGKNSVVATNALVRESMIGDDCVVGFSTEIARSYVGDKCWFHSNYVGDAVISDDCSFGAGAVLANLRLDEANIKDSGRNKLGPILGEHIRVGVNTSIMPGVRIGSNSFIGSGLTLGQDIEPNKYVEGKTELVIKDNRASIDPNARINMKSKLQ